jgi:hypothetical protein
MICRCCVIILFSFMLLGNARAENGAAQSALHDDYTRQIESLITRIKSDPNNSQQKISDSQKLPKLVSAANPESISDEVIDSLISLLKDDDDIVRFNTAKTLGSIGPRAKQAVPALESALKRIQSELSNKMWTGTSSEYEICPAIQNITKKEIAPGCAVSYPTISVKAPKN